ncbi:cupin domain-containing protein [Parafrigoribacterium mesophilum]
MVDYRETMQKTSLTALMRHELEHARTAPAGRSSKTVFGGHEKILRQTVIALRAGEGLDEHVSPGEATIYVLHGRVLLESGGSSWSGWIGDLLIVPTANLTLKALEDSALLFTVAKLVQPGQPATPDVGASVSTV